MASTTTGAEYAKPPRGGSAWSAMDVPQGNEKEKLYAQAQRYAREDGQFAEQQKQRDSRARIGSSPLILKALVTMDALLLGYEREIIGGDNVPKSGNGILLPTHQLRPDVDETLISAYKATGRRVSPLVELDSNQSSFESFLAELFDVTWELRGNGEIEKRRKRESYDELRRKALEGYLLGVWGEGTFSPQFDRVLGIHAGGSTKLARDVSNETGQKMFIYPQVNAYEFDEKGEIRMAHVEFLDPFDATTYRTEHDAADELQQVLLKKKIEKYKKVMPDMTPEQWTIFRAVQAAKSKNPDPDYYWRGHFSLDHRFAEKADDKIAIAGILAMFDDRRAAYDAVMRLGDKKSAAKIAKRLNVFDDRLAA